jgi:hypothetical protein
MPRIQPASGGPVGWAWRPVLSATALLCLAMALPGAVAEEQELNCYGDISTSFISCPPPAPRVPS